ncbi:interferon alpha-1-like [Hoplias malabaricus]|uniref:interferon alpha-1-like n=1 Tax=Hoplias malabaricus TaxID=27720 RepID=UPI003461B21B
MSLQILALISALLCTAHVCSMPTGCRLQRRLVTRTHDLIETMAGPLPVRCLPDKAEIGLPTQALQSASSSQDVGVSKAVYKTLVGVGSLMQNDSFPQSWDLQKMHELQSLVDRQIEENKCILSLKTQGSEDDFPARDVALTKYFQQLKQLLVDKKYSECGWEVVRSELRRILQYVLEHNSKHI